MGNAFCPGRPSEYQLNQVSNQATHHFYIAYCPELFMKHLHYLGVSELQGSFLDVGSGIGEKPFIAYSCGRFNRCDGLEYDARTIAVAEFLLNNLQTKFRYPISFEWGDATTFNRYHEYDVIYMYRPMRDQTRMRELFCKIGTEMKIGATCLDIYERDLAIRRVGANHYAMVSGIDTKGLARWETVLPLKECLDLLLP
jgi:hypothetical protein